VIAAAATMVTVSFTPIICLAFIMRASYRFAAITFAAASL
jgi:hypothetical protein